jgi:hypothetical protein
VSGGAERSECVLGPSESFQRWTQKHRGWWRRDVGAEMYVGVAEGKQHEELGAGGLMYAVLRCTTTRY